MKKYTAHVSIPADIAVPPHGRLVLCLLKSDKTSDWIEPFFMGYYDEYTGQWRRARNDKSVEVQGWIPLDVLPPIPRVEDHFVFVRYEKARKLKESKE